MTQQELMHAGETACAHLLADETASPNVTRRAALCSLAALRGEVGRIAWREEQGETLPSAGEWLLDHLEGYESHALQALEGFHSRERLPALSQRGDTVRVLLLAEEALRCAGTGEECLAFLEGVQSAAPLSEGEHSLLGGALVLSLLPQLRQLCLRVSEADWGREDLSQEAAELEQRFALERELASPGFARKLAGLSMAERIFSGDPSGLYPKLDEESRAACRRLLARAAKKRRVREADYAKELLRRAGEENCTLTSLLTEQPGTGRWYPSLLLGLTAVLTLALTVWASRWWLALLLLIPVSEGVKQGTDALCLWRTPVRPLLRLSLPEGIPAEGRTLCVIPALLTGEEKGPQLAARLESAALISRDCGKELRFALLIDLPDSAAEPASEGREGLEQLRQAIAGLNRRYQGGFFLFYRKPAYAPQDRCWRGWERKRGALLELGRYLRRLPSGIQLLEGDRQRLSGTRFLLTLDEDTRLLPETAKKLVATLLYPDNRPQVDQARRVVVSGYGILQPAIRAALEERRGTIFGRLFGGSRGTEPYAFSASELYRDLFDRGSYTGKGLLEIDAFLSCLDGRFPQNRVLSHDLLEGEYLHTGLAGDLYVLDGVPAHPLAYYRRLHRWTRGDWQLLPWLGRRVADESGAQEDNPLSLLSKWKLLDNLRRSLLPVSLTLLLVTAGCAPLPGGAGWLLAAVALLVLALPLCLALLGRLLRGGGWGVRYRSASAQGMKGEFLTALVRGILLPCEAWVECWAIGTALWRIAVSKRRCLEWTVSSASGEEKRLSVSYLRLLPAVAVALWCLLLGRTVPARLLGLLWMASPWIGWTLGQEEPEVPALEERDRRILLEEAGKLWQYFDTFLTEETHYLPPDNVQEAPAMPPSRRTSPTNMGLALLSCLAAVDLCLTEEARAVFLLERQLAAMEALPRSHGHFYNWYDIAAMEPLYPRYLSTVDSGNLCAALLAAAQGMRQLGREDLAARAEALARGMDFAFLYDKEQHLFYLGWDAEGETYTNSWYDLMCSEARTASYVAVALGQVEPRHWRHLSRAMVRGGRYTGMASWSGTSFEYFMPQLLLPAPRGSLLRETLAFCVAEQYACRGAQQGLWGISESAYFALNPDGSYCYRANGTPALALRRDVGRRVIAPYASLLALPLTPRLVMQNLRRLRELGMSGTYGLYDAYDLTEQGGAVTKNWMVHHQGMALVAIDNTLRGNLMVRRMMAEPSMGAYALLLGERLPEGIRFTRREERHGTMGRIRTHKAATAVTAERTLRLYSDGRFHTLITCRGGGWCTLEGKRLTAGSAIATLQVAEGRRWRTLFPAGEGTEPKAELALEAAVLRRETESLRAEERVEVRSGLNGLLLRLQLENRTGAVLRFRLLVQPMLLEEEAWEAHPAFAKLAVVSEEVRAGTVFTRRPKEGAQGLSLATLWSGPVTAWDTNRAYERCPSMHRGAVADPQLTLECSAPPRGTAVLTLALAAGERDQALRSAEGILMGLKSEEAPDALLRRYGLTQEEGAEADAILSHLLPWQRCRVSRGAEGPQQLWPFGLSGDLPIAVMELTEGREGDAARYAAEHAFLSRSGYPFDLVFLLGEQALAARLTKALQARHLPDTFGGTGGVHLIIGQTERWDTLHAVAACTLHGGGVSPSGEESLPLPEAAVPVPAEEGTLRWHWEEERFVLFLQDRLPPRRWSHLLANPQFGWLANECGTGFLWCGNAHENQLTPWQGDPLATEGLEDLTLHWGDQALSCFARLDGAETTIAYGPGLASWRKVLGGKTVTLEATVPPSGGERRFTLTLKGFSQPVTLRWKLTPLLAERMRDGRFAQVREEGGAVLATNPANLDFPGQQLRFAAVGAHLRLEEGKALSVVLSCPVGERLELVTSVSPVQQSRAAELLAERGWEGLCAPLRVETPDEGLNHYLSFWCLYQVTACRLFGRTGLYQCGGAYGFRDQLQDVCALMVHAPELVREQLLRAAEHQFVEGDVQHWWHPVGSGEPERGVRTRISDDLLWLPYGLSLWLETTGDLSLLREEAGFLTSDPLEPGELERYEGPERSTERATLYEHGCRAIHCALSRGTGSHGLLLMGAGDWNDGLNRVGAQGCGESVWLTWFAALVLKQWSAVAQSMGDEPRSARCGQRSAELAAAASRAWDGDWYLRGYDDSGAPFGGADHPCYALDSIAQSFAVLAPNPEPERGREAVLNAVNRLYDRKRGTIALLTPGVSPGSGMGYLQSYPEGVRENGGQYTHAAVWLALACCRLGLGETGWQLLRAMLPEYHAGSVYEGEPYVLAGDVSTARGYEGRCGWSWYTGAAAWYYRTVVEEVLGLQVRGGALFLRPCLPEGWSGYRGTLRLKGGTFRITVHAGGPERVLLDGAPVDGGIPLEQGGRTVEITVFAAQKGGATQKASGNGK